MLVEDEFGVLLGDDGTADPAALEPELVDQCPGRRTAGGVAEHAAGRRQPERLVRLPPAPGLVEAQLDRRLVGWLEAGRRGEDEIVGRGARGPGVHARRAV